MILKYLYADGSYKMHKIDLDAHASKEWIYIDSENKLEFIKKFLPSFLNGQKVILFDANHKQLLKYHQENDINKFENIQEINTKSQVLFFTSGSSGFPIGAFKSRANLEEEVLVLKELIKDKNIKRVVVSVPFVHIYGILAGLLLPLYLDDTTLIVKDDFLPYELLQEASVENTLVITTPVFIKALVKLNESKNLNSTIFISSTAPLDADSVASFEKKFQTNLMQLFGSTETGGIAYKFSASSKWKPLEKVIVSLDNDKLCIKSPFISSFILDKKIIKLENKFTTEDIIELEKDGFKLIGRSNKIIKIAGKRISAMQIESILKDIESIDEAIVELVYKKELLRSEQLMIILQAKEKIDKKEIKKKINEYFGVLTIPFNVKYIEKIRYSSVGKKILYLN